MFKTLLAAFTLFVSSTAFALELNADCRVEWIAGAPVFAGAIKGQEFRVEVRGSLGRTFVTVPGQWPHRFFSVTRDAQMLDLVRAQSGGSHQTVHMILPQYRPQGATYRLELFDRAQSSRLIANCR